jgi:hypothetical protein
VRLRVSLQDLMRLEPQLTAWPAANVTLTSLVPEDVRSQLEWKLERSITPRFLAHEVQTFLLYKAAFPHKRKGITYMTLGFLRTLTLIKS